MRKILILILIAVFYILTLFQSSFLVHFNISGVVPNLVLILVCLLSFFEKPNQHLGIFGAIIGGFFLDIFSNSFIGISIIVLIIISFFIKKSLHFLKETSERYPIIYFLPLFIFSLIFYDLALVLVSQFNLSLGFLIEIIYNSAFAFLGFYIFKGLYSLRS